MIVETPYYTVHHEGDWQTLKQNGRPYITSLWTKFEGKFKTKAEAKEYEKQLRLNPKCRGDLMFVVLIDQKKALEEFQREWSKPGHGIYRDK